MYATLKDERGQSLGLIAIFLIALMGMMALILDGGNAYAQRRFVQNAADSAALAGATFVTMGNRSDASVVAIASQYASANRGTLGSVTYLDANGAVLAVVGGAVPDHTVSVRVTASRAFTTFFAGLIGVPSMTASATATASAFPAQLPTTMAGLAPLSVPMQLFSNCQGGNYCNLWDPRYMQMWNLPPGSFKTFVDLSNGNMDQSSAPQTLGNWTYQGYPGAVGVNSWLPIVSGNMGANISTALRGRILLNPYYDVDGSLFSYIDMVVWDSFAQADQQLNLPDRVHTVRFAKFKVRYDDVGASAVIGTFVAWVVPTRERGGGGGPADPKIIVLTE